MLGRGWLGYTHGKLEWKADWHYHWSIGCDLQLWLADKSETCLVWYSMIAPLARARVSVMMLQNFYSFHLSFYMRSIFKFSEFNKKNYKGKNTTSCTSKTGLLVETKIYKVVSLLFGENILHVLPELKLWFSLLFQA